MSKENKNTTYKQQENGLETETVKFTNKELKTREGVNSKQNTVNDK